MRERFGFWRKITSLSFLLTCFLFRNKKRKNEKTALVSPLLVSTPLDDSRRLVLAGGAAVVAVNLVILLYVLSAFAEGGIGGSGGGGKEEKKIK